MIACSLGAAASSRRAVRGIDRSLARLENLMNEAIESEAPGKEGMAFERRACAIAWTASIAGAAAVRAIVVVRRGPLGGLETIERRAARLLGCAQLVLDESHDACAGLDASSPLRTLVAVRRARLALVEWSMRLAAGELTEDAIDELDLVEIRASCVPFPLARRSALLARAEALAIAGNWTD